MIGPTENPKLMDFARGPRCGNKRSFVKRDEAKRRAKEQLKAKGIRLYVYKCDCGFFHFTSMHPDRYREFAAREEAG